MPVVLTFDIDWAPDFMIDFVAEGLTQRRVRATWFVTHASPAVEWLREHPDLFELGIHPNFAPGSTQGDSPEAVLRHCLRLEPRPQPEDPSLFLRCFPRTPEDAEIDWRRSAEEIGRLVRASSEPFAGAFTHLNGERLTVWRARAGQLSYPWAGVPGQVAEIDSTSGEAAVLTGGGVLFLEEVETPSTGRGRPAGLIRSTRLRFFGNGGPR